MSENEIREPIQKRSIETKDKIIEAGFELICNDGYYKTNTAKIAKKAGVSTGIVYQYFKDKRDIFLSSLEKYADDIFYPMLKMPNLSFDKSELSNVIRGMIDRYISNHKLSAIAHEEITAMAHNVITPPIIPPGPIADRAVVIAAAPTKPVRLIATISTKPGTPNAAIFLLI